MSSNSQYIENSDSDSDPGTGITNNFYDPNISHPDIEYRDELGVVCPSHTTERRLIAKIDRKVIPVLSILYLLAFLDRYGVVKSFHRAKYADNFLLEQILPMPRVRKPSIWHLYGSQAADLAVFGLSSELGLLAGSNQYNTALTIFFVPYVVRHKTQQSNSMLIDSSPALRNTVEYPLEEAQAPCLV